MFNLLDDRLITIAIDSQTETATLPEVYAALIADKVVAFPALRPHQRHAWHAFLVQLGAMALLRAGRIAPPDAADEWRDLIRRLTPECPHAEPWQLVIEDITVSAFLQPPASAAGKIADYKNVVETPDGLDMLVTSKNHDLKSAVASAAEVSHWIFALITLQTMEGFSGAGNYGISRMNGGLGCRPAFTLTPSERPGTHVRRDIGALLEKREGTLDLSLTRDGGVQLLWTKPWDGTRAEALLLSDLDPFYIEICRRVRLRADSDGKLSAVRATSKAARIEAKALKGVTGDPWTPVSKTDSKCLTLAAGGFTYKRTADYLLEADWEAPPLLKPTRAEEQSSEGMRLVARAMVRGQGKTEGYYERIVPLKPKTVRAIGQARDHGDLGDIANGRIDDVRRVQRILRHGVWTFAAGGKTERVGDETRALANPWANRLDHHVDVTFFDDLQEEFEADSNDARDQIRRNWQRRVISDARNLLRQAQDTLPCPAIHRYRARVRSDRVFEGRIRGNTGFPDLFDLREAEQE
ncbi:MAG: type I-E CRISPR-associated protein Cse1/CasA [Chloroflexi bacterium]|nr:type I-E CRISPR-associated protein Cse1/CasA [Chloroflexota bacterium]